MFRKTLRAWPRTCKTFMVPSAFFVKVSMNDPLLGTVSVNAGIAIKGARS
jgi:hypothetical protein